MISMYMLIPGIFHHYQLEMLGQSMFGNAGMAKVDDAIQNNAELNFLDNAKNGG